MYSMQGGWATSTRPYTAQRSDTRPRNVISPSRSPSYEIPTATTTSWLRRPGITAGSWYASPAIHVGHELIAAGMLILAGRGAGRSLDYVELGGRVLVSSGDRGTPRGALTPTVPESERR